MQDQGPDLNRPIGRRGFLEAGAGAGRRGGNGRDAVRRRASCPQDDGIGGAAQGPRWAEPVLT